MTERRLNDLALRQISEIHDYIAQYDALAAQKVVDRIHAIIALVTERPGIGRRTRESGVRSYTAKPHQYVVFYRYSEKQDEVQIIRVRHAAMRRAGLQDEVSEFRAVVMS